MIQVTEQIHPATVHLSEYANHDLNAGLSILKQIEIDAQQAVLAVIPQLKILQQCIREQLHSNGTIYIVGCGASGRAAALLEWIWRTTQPSQQHQRVRAVLAGGDIALIESVEDIEDHGALAIKQLQHMGFKSHDFIIGLSASGSANFVQYACLHGAKQGKGAWLIVNNPVDQIKQNSKLKESGVSILPLVSGPLPLTGSTRMHTTTVMLSAIATTLFGATELKTDMTSVIQLLTSHLQQANWQQLVPFIIHEADVLKQRQQNNDLKHPVIYRSPNDLALTVLADLTERAPTFSIPAVMPHMQGWFALSCDTNQWSDLLLRDIDALNWQDYPQTKTAYLNQFTFRDTSDTTNKSALSFERHDHALTWQCGSKYASFPVLATPSSWQYWLNIHCLLKALINAHSTLVMGRLNRYEGNVMTALAPNNKKLLARAIYLTQYLYQLETGQSIPEIQVQQALNDTIKQQSDAPIVKTTLKKLLLEDNT